MKQTRLKPDRLMSIEERKKHKRNMDQALTDFNSRRNFRLQRARARNFLKGEQWNDLIYDNKYDDHVTEKEYLERRGRLTTKNNQIGPIIRNLVGQFRESYPSSIVYARNREDASLGDMMTEALRYVEDVNEVSEIDVQQFREALISGAWGNRIEFDWFENLQAPEVSMDPIEQHRFAYNADVQDIRLRDLKRWVYLHDMEIDEIIQHFADKPRDAKQIMDWYGRGTEDYMVDWNELTGSDIPDTIDFYMTNNLSKHRVIEVWRKEFSWVRMIHDHQLGIYERTDMYEREVEALNDQRIDQILDMKVEVLKATGQSVDEQEINQMRQIIELDMQDALIEFRNDYLPVWHVYFYTPYGDLLFESETPYDHNQSPIELSLHPMIDGEVYGLVSEIIDQQKYFNRMISMLDFLITSSAKGVLLIDKRMVPKEYISKNTDGSDNMDAFIENWVEFDGVIYYESDPNNPTNLPQHIVNNSMPAGLNDMIRLQHDLLEKISGVVGPVAGHNPSSGTPASLYMQQTINASMTNRDIFESYYSWQRRRNRKVIQLIQQYWDEVRYIKTGGQRSTALALTQYDPMKVRGVNFDLVVSEGQKSAVFRQVIDESLKEYMLNQLITFEEYLEESTLPFADSLLEKVRQRKQQEQAIADEEMAIAEEQMPQQGIPSMQQQQSSRQPVALPFP